MIGSVVWIIIGLWMFTRFRDAQKAQKRTQAIIWMLGSAFFAAFGLLGLLGSMSA